MIQPGDTVRYLNAVGGGKVIRVEGKLAYVDDDGFETPVRVNELVVVLPAGHTPDRPGKMMFDQKAFDTGRSDHREPTPEPQPVKAAAPQPAEEDFPIEETEYGDSMTLLLAFEPDDIKNLSTARFNAVLVNDSNYFLSYQLMRRDPAGNEWIEAARGEAAPNELVDLRKYDINEIGELERIVFQALAYKKDKPFGFKSPVNVSRKLDLTKFFKLHCFRPGVYFDAPVLEVPLYSEEVKQFTPKPSRRKK